MANEVTPIPSQSPAVQIGFANDFKSCALWALLGVVGGVMLAMWMMNQKEE